LASMLALLSSSAVPLTREAATPARKGPPIDPMNACQCTIDYNPTISFEADAPRHQPKQAVGLVQADKAWNNQNETKAQLYYSAALNFWPWAFVRNIIVSNMPYHGAAQLNLLGAPAKKVWKPTIVHRGALFSNTTLQVDVQLFQEDELPAEERIGCGRDCFYWGGPVDLGNFTAQDYPGEGNSVVFPVHRDNIKKLMFTGLADFALQEQLKSAIAHACLDHAELLLPCVNQGIDGKRSRAKAVNLNLLTADVHVGARDEGASCPCTPA